MRRSTSYALLGVAGAAATLVLLGVAMGETHDPVAIEPDAKLPPGVQVATVALG